VVTDEVLQKTPEDSLYESPFFPGLTFGSALWVVYAWMTRLQYGMLPSFHHYSVLSLVSLIRPISRSQLSIHAHCTFILTRHFRALVSRYNVL
jgi:hypothetical protein